MPPFAEVSRKWMLHNLLILTLVLFTSISLNAQHGTSSSSISTQQIRTASHTVISIGNVGDIEKIGRFATALNSLLDSLEHNQTIIFNGDLTQYQAFDERSCTALDSLVQLLRNPSRRKLIFLPGDRDWDNSGRDGWDNVSALEEHITDMDYADVIWPLSNGCPGPERISLDLTLNLLAINTQWWNHRHVKPSPSSATCKYGDEESVLEEIRGEIEDAGYGNVIVAGHFPIVSHGMYGGSYPWHKWLFPVPVVNTAITAYKQNIGSNTEIANEQFEDFREDMEDVFKEYNSIIYFSGHEYNREILKYEDNIFINSGAMAEAKYVDKVRETVFASSDPGIVLTHFDVDGNAWVSNYAYSEGAFDFEEEALVMQAPCVHPDEGITVNERLVPCLQEAYVLTEMSDEHPDSVKVAANPNYEHSGFVKFLFGKHYRDSWTAPVTVSMLDLDSTFHGLFPYAVGGGRQTSSLKFSGENGYAYVFRSVDKDPSGALTFDLRHTLVSLAVRDQTTTQYPYGAIVTSALLDSLDILHARPGLYVLPDDGKLGPFQNKYGGMLGMLEDFPTGRKVIRNTFAGADEIKRSISMFRDLYKDKNNRINQTEYVRARVFDILIGDWGRHEDNWKWAGYSTDTGIQYRPIPRDRDHAFSKWDGILPWIADREWAMPNVENFDYKIKDIRSLTWQARHLDRFLGSELSRKDWQVASHFVQEKMTDDAIDKAIAGLPNGAELNDVEEIAAKLKVRRDQLDEFTERLYDLLAKEVDVVGSIESELFEVTRLADGKVLVEMFGYKNQKKGGRLYSREFDPEETKEIRLFGLLGNDRFEVAGEVNESILIRIVPGRGRNVVMDMSEVKKGGKLTRVYSDSDHNQIEGSNETIGVKIPFEEAYRYDRTAFTYNTYLPFGYLYYTSDNGFQVGAGVNFTRQAYDKPDFSAKHNLFGSVSTLGNVHVSYSGIVRHVLSEWDLTLDALGSDNKRFNYFFGLGNDIEFDQDSLRNDYYTLRYSTVSGSIGLKRTFWKQSAFAIGLQIGNYGEESRTGNILDEDLPPELGGVQLLIGRLNWSLDMDLRDRPNLPTSGVRIMAEGYFANRLNIEGAYSMTKGSFEWHGTARPVTFSLRAGGWFHHRLPPFYDLEYLGHNTHLRGFRRNRFAGDRAGAYFNSEIRVQLIDNTQSLIPHKIGIILFYDAGRVFQSDEESNTWHNGYGFGVYVVPVRERFVLGMSLGFSVEESAFLKLGFGKLF